MMARTHTPLGFTLAALLATACNFNKDLLTTTDSDESSGAGTDGTDSSTDSGTDSSVEDVGGDTAQLPATTAEAPDTDSGATTAGPDLYIASCEDVCGRIVMCKPEEDLAACIEGCLGEADEDESPSCTDALTALNTCWSEAPCEEIGGEIPGCADVEDEAEAACARDAQEPGELP